MPTDLEQQLPQFAMALDHEAPAISLEEIFSRGTVVFDGDRGDRDERPALEQISPVTSVSGGGAMGDRGEGEHEASVEFVPTVAAAPLARRRGALKVALRVAAAAVLIVALAAVVRFGDAPEEPADVPTTTATTLPTTVPVDAFVAVWRSTDTDGSSQTMEIARVDPDEYDVVLTNGAADAACAGGAATLAGVGRLATDTSLVVAQPELTCDDGNTPPIRLTPQREFANFTLDLDTTTGELVDNFGAVWRRAGSNVEVDEPTMTVRSLSEEMWPQSTLEEAQAAQDLADAGDPEYTWQLEPELVSMEFEEPGQVELVDRFLREVLGWEAYLFHSTEVGTWRNGAQVDLDNQRYLRCAPDRTNPLYPPGAQPSRGELCAPTIDDLTYETVNLDLTQPADRGPDGIWVVNQWDPASPIRQADPAVVEAQGRERLEEFLAARVAGTGADGQVQADDDTEVPLLYATSSGVPYKRYEIDSEIVGRPQWPWASMAFSARLFTEDDATVVEQRFSWSVVSGLRLAPLQTTENGQPIIRTFTSPDDEVTVAAPDTWTGYLAGKFWDNREQDMWIGSLWRREDRLSSEDRIELVDPVAYDAWCADNGGSPLLTAPANAAQIAQQLIADPNFDTTTPVAARIGGVDAVSIDVTLAPGGKACGIGMIDIPRWIHTLSWDDERDQRLRLYLVDLPDGMSVDTLAITIVASDDRFDAVLAETAPIIESIQFDPG